jgi:hypothetical protein
MGATAAIVGSWLAGGGAAAIGRRRCRCGDLGGHEQGPTINMPAPPQIDPNGDPAAATKKAEGAADQQRKRSAAAGATGSTILTGPGGLGQVSADQQGRKNLLRSASTARSPSLACCTAVAPILPNQGACLVDSRSAVSTSAPQAKRRTRWPTALSLAANT